MTLMEESEMDLLICGSCQKDFPLARITTFMKHKKFDCEEPGIAFDSDISSLAKSLFCQTCPEKFNTPWKLLLHAQNFHKLQIYGEQIFDQPREGNKSTSLIPGSVSTSKTEWKKHASPYNDEGVIMDKNGGFYDQSYLPSTIPLSESPSLFDNENGPMNKANLSANDTLPYVDSSTVIGKIPDADQYRILDKGKGVGPQQELQLVLPKAVGDDDIRFIGTSHPLAFKASATTVDEKNMETVASPILKHPVVTHLNTIENKLRNTSDIGIQTTRPTTTDLSADEETKSCCNSQDCGVTVMPGTHESLKKCCSAVVPKKRKRHMETKHMSLSGKSRRRYRGMSYVKMAEKARSQAPPSIYIDVEPHIEDDNQEDNTSSSGQNKHLTNLPGREDSQPARVMSTGSGQKQINVDRSPSVHENRERSVIIKPGTTFSIPVSYTRNIQPVISLSTASSLPTKVANMTGTFCEPKSVPSASQKQHAASLDSVNVFDSETTPILPGQTLPVIASIWNPKMDTLTSKVPINSGGSVSSMETGVFEQKCAQERAEDQHSSDDNMDNAMDSVQESDRHHRQKKRRYPTSRPFKCDKCDNAFNQRIHLKKHQSKHTGIKPFKCDQCDYSTVERSHLKVHIRVHTGEKPFKCTYCEYATAQNSTLKIHLQRHHSRSGTSEQASNKPTGQGYDDLTWEKCQMTFPKEEALSANTLQTHPESNQGEVRDMSDPSVPSNNSLSTGQQSAVGGEITTPGPERPTTSKSDSSPGGSGMVMTVADNSVIFTGSGLEQVLSLLGRSLQSSAQQTTLNPSQPQNTEDS